MRVSEPTRVTRSETIRIAAPPDDVFPLMCPVRERDWLEGWSPECVYSESGLVEAGCVFTSVDDNGESIWLVTEHDAAARRVAMVKVTPGLTACRLVISLSDAEPGTTEATVTYTHTALSPRGERFVETFTQAGFERTMAHWRAALEHYLATGARLARGS